MAIILETIKQELLKWPGATVEPHHFGGIDFRCNKRELGHIHGDRLADLPFPMNIRNELVNSGRVSPHHIFTKSGWVSYWIKGADDVAGIIEVFQLQYHRLKSNWPIRITS